MSGQGSMEWGLRKTHLCSELLAHGLVLREPGGPRGVHFFAEVGRHGLQNKDASESIERWESACGTRLVRLLWGGHDGCE